ncbi:hypothetical protein [Solimicrobium silvestre]|nr:hypothetical protein [Solimicrobium silvestre]
MVSVHAGENQSLVQVAPDEIARVPGMTADYVRTPHGYFHSSCVQHIDQSEELQVDGSIKRADGKLRQVAQCAYPRFLNNGTRIEATAKNTRLPEVYNGYLQLVSATLSSGTNELTAYMTVPPNPSSESGQTLYFFPGLEDAQNVVSILQPVLGWDGYGANNWTIASWNCCKSGTTYVGNNVVVKPGDLIYGTMVNTGGQNWTITATDETNTSLASATLKTQGYSQTFDWVFAGALETYGVSSCSQFPSSGPIKFTNIQAYVGGKVVSNPSWSIQPGSNSETACTKATVVDSKDVNISY